MNQVSIAIRLLKEGITNISQLYSNDQKKEVAFQIIKAQEDERRRIAREIHDGPAQSLANIILRLEITEKLLAIDYQKAKKELHDLNILVRENLKDIRRIIFDLRPIVLDSKGIVETIKEYIKNYEKTYGIQCFLNVEGIENNVNSSIKIALFRLVQEGMTNVAKHANSSKCEILLQFSENLIKGQIIDYGTGFNVEQVFENPAEKFGLIGMKERIEMYSGKFSIKSTIGKGTVFAFELPTLNKEV